MKLVYIHTLYMRRVLKSSKVSIDILVLVSIYVYMGGADFCVVILSSRAVCALLFYD